MRKVTFTPSSLDRYATNGVQRSVTPDAFSAGTTAKVNSGYLVFHSCADAAEAVRASAAAPARMIRRLIMTPSLSAVEVDCLQCSLNALVRNAKVRPPQPCRKPEFLNRRDFAPPKHPSLRPPRARTARAQ